MDELDPPRALLLEPPRPYDPSGWAALAASAEGEEEAADSYRSGVSYTAAARR